MTLILFYWALKRWRSYIILQIMLPQAIVAHIEESWELQLWEKYLTIMIKIQQIILLIIILLLINSLWKYLFNYLMIGKSVDR